MAEGTPSHGWERGLQALDEAMLGAHATERDYYQRHRGRFAASARAIADWPAGRVADIGSLYLHFPALLRAMGHEVVAIDSPAVPQMDEMGGDYTGRLERHAITFRPWEGVSTALPLGSGEFDAVTFIETLEHLPCRHQRILAQIHAGLRPGGLLLLTVPNVLRFDRVMSILSGRGLPPNLHEMRAAPHDASVHYKEYMRREVRTLLRETGFDVLRHTTFNYTRLEWSGGRFRALKRALQPVSRLWPLGGESHLAIARRA